MWLSVHSPSTPPEAPHDEDQHGPVIPQWRVDAPHCMPPPRVGTVGAQWVRAFAKKHYEHPEPTRRAIVLERDERWHSLKKKRRKLLIWKPWIVVPAPPRLGMWAAGQSHAEEDGRSPGAIAWAAVLPRQRGHVCVGHATGQVGTEQNNDA
jgi:hypothetical protein